MAEIIFKLVVVFFVTWYPYSLAKFGGYNKQIEKLCKRIKRLEQENKQLKENTKC